MDLAKICIQEVLFHEDPTALGVGPKQALQFRQFGRRSLTVPVALEEVLKPWAIHGGPPPLRASWCECTPAAFFAPGRARLSRNSRSIQSSKRCLRETCNLCTDGSASPSSGPTDGSCNPGDTSAGGGSSRG